MGVLDYVPVGILLRGKQTEGLVFVNKEFVSLIPGTVARARLEQVLHSEVDPELKREQMRRLLQSLDYISDSETGHTLRTALQRTDDKDQGDIVYHMASDISQRVYEVKTKYLPSVMDDGCKIAVIKDQTVYRQLVKQRLLEKCQ